ncbi:lactonase family protein [Dactylosporangium sp. CA-092794]|uniref:lactonase family protein n=1 Tax=Dactylosporangium sp. CA-092794 TaxID=3239929 RepID=UPI003D93D429
MTLYYSGSDSHGGLSELALWRGTGHGLERIGALALRSPSWVEPHPRLPILYATQESEPGAVIVVEAGPDGSLHERQRVPSHGALPCHLAVDETGARLVVSNYLDGTVAAWSLASDGAIEEPAAVWQLSGSGPVAGRQEGSHAHLAHPRHNDILVADLGADAVVAVSPGGGQHVEAALPPGFGPRHFVMIGDDRAVLVGELSAELALIELRGPGSRVLDLVPATRSGGAQPSGITARGNDVIVANRVVGTIAAFAVEGDRLVAGEEIRLPGDNPRAITSDARHTYVCVQDAGCIATYVAGEGDAPRLTPAPHVSDFGVIPWSRAFGRPPLG